MKRVRAFLLVLIAAFCFILPAQASNREDDKKLFEKVSSNLDIGGSYLNFQNNKYLFKAVENTYKQLPAAIKVIVPNEQQRLMSLMIYNFMKPIVQNLGIDEILAVGTSSILIADKTDKYPALFRSRQFIYYGDKKVKGLVWNFIHEENSEFTELASLPKETLFASASKTSPERIWNKIKFIFSVISFIPAQNALSLIEQSFFNKFQIKLPDFFDSLSGTWSSLLVRSKSDEGKDAIFLMLKIPNKKNLVFKVLSELAKSQKDLKVSATEINTTISSPVKWIKPLIRRDEKNVYIVSNEKILQIVKDTADKKNGLISTDKFKYLRQALPEKGVAFAYFNDETLDVAINIAKDNSLLPPKDWAVLAKLLPPSSFFAVAFKKKDGIMYSMNSPMDIPQFISYTSLMPSILQLTILANRKTGARQNTCINKLRKIGLALKMHAMNHKDKYPVENNVAGLKQLISVGYLTNNSVFICPESRQFKATGKDLKEANSSYIYLGGFTEGDGDNIPLVFDKLDTNKELINVFFQDGRMGALPNRFRSCKDLIKYLTKVYSFKPEILKKLQAKAEEIDKELDYK